MWPKSCAATACAQCRSWLRNVMQQYKKTNSHNSTPKVHKNNFNFFFIFFFDSLSASLLSTLSVALRWSLTDNKQPRTPKKKKKGIPVECHWWRKRAWRQCLSASDDESWRHDQQFLSAAMSHDIMLRHHWPQQHHTRRDCAHRRLLSRSRGVFGVSAAHVSVSVPSCGRKQRWVFAHGSAEQSLCWRFFFSPSLPPFTFLFFFFVRSPLSLSR